MRGAREYLNAMLAITGCDIADFMPEPREPLGDCPCGGTYYETAASKKPRCSSCKA